MTRRLFGCAVALTLALGGGDAAARADLAPGWRAVWNGRVPRRVYGDGIAVPGANRSALIAEAASRRLLAEHLALLGPGSTVGDWELVSNVVHGRGGEMRSVGFVQRHRGMRVVGGQLGFLFKRDRMIVMSSAAVPDVRVDPPAGLVDDVLILPTPRGLRTVRIAPLDGWTVYVEATTAEEVARVSTRSHGTAELQYYAPVRYPGGGYSFYRPDRANLLVNGTMAGVSDAGGVVTFPGTSATVRMFASGPSVRVAEFGTAGGAFHDVAGLQDGGSASWDDSATPLVAAQMTAFIHASIVKNFAVSELDPTLPWLGGPLDVVVNEPGMCNAYSDGNSLHFLVSGGGCENSALIADFVYHEFSHALHTHAFIPGVGANEPHMSEGAADYLAATITGDPGVGRGFRLAMGDAPERDLDPADVEAALPGDFDADDPHISGLIIGGALWDLRKELIAAHGAVEGKRLADDLYYAVLRRADDMAAAYVEVLAADDDNGQLLDGTPNKCAIDRAFGPHGLTDPSLTVGLSYPLRDDYQVYVPQANELPGNCPDDIASAVLTWHTDGAPQDIEMTVDDGGAIGLIPEQPDGTDVFYTVSVTTVSGARYQFPRNIADPIYHFHVAALIPVYCTDFESDPFAAGWTHSAGPGSSDWQWGPPVRIPRVGDPGGGVSTSRVVGTELGGNGAYAPSTVQQLTSPVIDLGGRSGARLQYYRWLSVEDGFYDDAHVLADGEALWRNAVGQGTNEHLDHMDEEWRWHDLDLAAQAADDQVQITFRLESDGTLELGGWNIDDFCVMARALPGEICGDGALGGQEGCDDGNLLAGDGCDAVCQVEIDIEEGCCSTGAGSPAGPVGLGVLTAALLLRRRRYSVRTTSSGAFPRT